MASIKRVRISSLGSILFAAVTAMLIVTLQRVAEVKDAVNQAAQSSECCEALDVVPPSADH